MTGVHMAANMAVVASFELSLSGGLFGSSSRTTLRMTERKGMSSEVTNSGIVCGELAQGIWETLWKKTLTSVAQSKLTKTRRARQFCCSGTSMMGTKRMTKKMAIEPRSVSTDVLTSQTGRDRRPSGVLILLASTWGISSPCSLLGMKLGACPRKDWPNLAASPLRSIPMSSRQTVFRSQTTCSRR
jgi:hypothetical protein